MLANSVLVLPKSIRRPASRARNGSLRKRSRPGSDGIDGDVSARMPVDVGQERIPDHLVDRLDEVEVSVESAALDPRIVVPTKRSACLRPSRNEALGVAVPCDLSAAQKPPV
jgi:hypothetical protein